MEYKQVTLPPRVLICGESTTGKTGSLAMLSNAGYRIMLHDFDNNSRVIGNFLKDGHAPIYTQTYDVVDVSDDLMGDIAKPAARAKDELRRFFKQLSHWKTDTEDLGKSTEWTPKDIVVIDSGTFLGRLCILAAHLDPETKRDGRSLYNTAGKYFHRICVKLRAANMGASVIMLTHIQLTGDKDEQGNILNGVNIPTAVGTKMSESLPSYFTDVWRIEVNARGERQYKTAATSKMGLRASTPNIKATEPFDLAAMFSKLGV